MALYVWSDTHFNHKKIMEYCPTTRPYNGDVEAMNAGIIERWNSVVTDADEIYLLGDFAMNARGVEAIFAQLHGHKHLIKGNHDEHNPKVLNLPWASVHNLVTLREEGIRAVACHYPIESWNKAHHGYLMLHGHSHGSLEHKMAHRYDVGADVEWAPVTLKALAERAAAEPWAASDHHGAD